MNTASNQPTIPDDVRGAIGREIMSVLNACTIDVPIEQTIQELQVAIERLSFGGETMGPDISMDDIDTLLNGDISAGTMQFINWLQERKSLSILMGQRGNMFLAFCIRYYRTIREVKCITPVVLSEGFRISLLGQLRTIYPEPTRILFDVSPSLVAGCVIDDGEKRTDMSLRSASPSLVRRFITRHAHHRRHNG